MTLQKTTVEYFDRKTCLEGFFVYDDAVSRPLPAVLIAHAWGGRDDFVMDKALKLAQLGYATFALDIYGKGILGRSIQENSALMSPFMKDRALLQRRLTAGLETVRNQKPVNPDKIAAMGFCFGGLCVLDLARTGADLCGVVSFHGLLAAPGNTSGNAIKAKVLVLHGHADPMAPAEEIKLLQDELTRAGSDWQLHVYGNTLHAFTNPLANDPNFGTLYEPRADRRSWQTMRLFFEECFED